MNRKFQALVLYLLLVCLPLGACNGENEPGIVASVNGEPITMRELQARHDLDHMSWLGLVTPSAEELQSQYGDSLISLIINHLVMQELEELDLAVSDEEMNQAEQEIRSGYGEDEFNSILEDDAINLEMWRLFLRQRLSIGKFMQTALRPQIRISSEEISDYYSRHSAEFKLPTRYHFWVLESQSEESLAEFLKAYVEAGEISLIPDSIPHVPMREVRMREDRLPPERQKILESLQVNQPSKIFNGGVGFEAVILIEKQEPAELTLAQAYPLIERDLVEKELEIAFANWVAERIIQSDIQIASNLADVWISYRLNPTNATYPSDSYMMQLNDSDLGDLLLENNEEDRGGDTDGQEGI